MSYKTNMKIAGLGQGLARGLQLGSQMSNANRRTKIAEEEMRQRGERMAVLDERNKVTDQQRDTKFEQETKLNDFRIEEAEREQYMNALTGAYARQRSMPAAYSGEIDESTEGGKLRLRDMRLLFGKDVVGGGINPETRTDYIIARKDQEGNLVTESVPVEKLEQFGRDIGAFKGGSGGGKQYTTTDQGVMVDESGKPASEYVVEQIKRAEAIKELEKQAQALDKDQDGKKVSSLLRTGDNEKKFYAISKKDRQIGLFYKDEIGKDDSFAAWTLPKSVRANLGADFNKTDKSLKEPTAKPTKEVSGLAATATATPEPAKKATAKKKAAPKVDVDEELMKTAKRAPDGNMYVQKNGKWYKVEE